MISRNHDYADTGRLALRDGAGNLRTLGIDHREETAKVKLSEGVRMGLDLVSIGRSDGKVAFVDIPRKVFRRSARSAVLLELVARNLSLRKSENAKTVLRARLLKCSNLRK